MIEDCMDLPALGQVKEKLKHGKYLDVKEAFEEVKNIFNQSQKKFFSFCTGREIHIEEFGERMKLLVTLENTIDKLLREIL